MAGNDNQILDLGMLEKAVLDDVLTKTGAQSVKPVQEIQTEKVETPQVQQPVTETTEGKGKKEQVNALEPITIDSEQKEKLFDILDDIDKEETSEDTGKGKPEDTVSPATSVYAAAAEYLMEQGAIPSLKDVKEIKTAEDFAKAIRAEIEASRYYDLNDEQKKYLELIDSGVSHEEVAPVLDMISNINSVTDRDIQNNQELRAIIIKADLESQGWPADRIEKQVARIMNSGDDIEEAFISRKNLLETKNQELEELKANAERAEQERVAAENKLADDLKKAIYGTDSFLGAVKVDGTLKDKVYNSMVTAVGEVNGIPVNALVKDRMDNPVDFERRLYYAYTITNGFKDLGKLQKAAESKAAKTLREAVESAGVIRTGSGSGMFEGNLNIPDIISV